jgi:hypothetical protein
MSRLHGLQMVLGAHPGFALKMSLPIARACVTFRITIGALGKRLRRTVTGKIQPSKIASFFPIFIRVFWNSTCA